MKAGVVGTRSFNDYSLMSKILKDYDITTIVSGEAPGADTLAKKYSIDNQLKYIEHKADWEKHGRAAGPIRNTLIVNDSDIIVAFWDGKSKGTLNTITTAKKQNKPVIVVDYVTFQIT